MGSAQAREDAGATERHTIDNPQIHPDEDTMRSFLSVGSYQRLIENKGEERVAAKILAAAEPHKTADGKYVFANRYLLSIFCT
ncbi:hypothetical protein [Lentzea sp. NPDC060358]|uniref:hypothetical protein n=1 Tax=Lentzea sp. NPDC060358 TaxID=3347103 RepID=UPI00365CDEDA